MRKNLPLVSIVTPSYNYDRFIEDTLLSVKNQDYPNIEHIVMDGGSNDHTVSILTKYEDTYNLKWRSEPDKGQSDAINKGSKIAQGQIIGWLDSDDVYFSKDTISSVVDLFLRNPNVGVVFGDDYLMDVNANLGKVRIFSNWSYSKLLRGFSISQPATFFRRKVLEKNFLRSDLHYIMDYEFWLRLGRTYGFKHTNKILAGNRIHKSRKSIAGAQKAKLEKQSVLKSYGAKTSLEYYLTRYSFDTPYYYMSNVLSIIRILRNQKSLNRSLSFRGKYGSTLQQIIKQVEPYNRALNL